MALGGSALAVAHVLATTGGCHVDFCSMVGDDQMAKVFESCRHPAVTYNVAKHPTAPTATCVVLAGPADRSFLSVNGAMEAFSFAHLPQEKFLAADHIHFSGYFQCPKLQTDKLLDFLKKLKKEGKTISLDTQSDATGSYEGENQNLSQLLPLLDIFLPSEIEATNITKKATKEESLEILCEKYPETLIIVKCGEEGSIGGKGKTERYKKDVIKVEVADTVGAGDAYVAGFLIKYLAEKKSVEEAMQYATALGAKAVSSFGGPANHVWSPDDISKLF
eukprot:TRINITY_DN6678_c0_g1_i1.p1 TRINITY_DN6678_c0_g1~~TRINITY_DN6678_c0_g1_i1.p1  ORF type:complete len:319 (+),score=69.57 TRINITY_DN6678_c0_g1_i1:129-959(+)